MIRSGTLPLWTPYLFSGYPLLSMAQLGLGYPVTWGYLFLPGHWAETIYVVAPFFLSPLFLFVYLREIGRSRLASFAGALGFAYGGMMSSQLANGMLPNAVMWAPLILTAIERSRTRRFVPCLVAATFFYTMSVLTGIGQGIVFAGLLAGVYACFVSAVDFSHARVTSRLSALKPVALILCAALLSLGIASFQIFETLPSVQLSIREKLTYGIFSQLSMPFWVWWRALFVPLYFQIESVPYVSPLILLLALIAAVAAFRRPRANYLSIFWVVVAVTAMLLMLGSTLPIYRIVFHIPVLNRFRGPSRHSFEWTLAISVLSAAGWDLLAAFRSRLKTIEKEKLFVFLSAVLLILAVVIAGLWILYTIPRFPMASVSALNRAVVIYASWKTALLVVTVGALFYAWRLKPSSIRSAILGFSAALLCVVEAYVFMAFSWAWIPVSSEWFKTVQPSTQYLLEHLERGERAYIRVPAFFHEELKKRIDVLNLPARYHIQNVGGYEPLISRQYSRALHDVWLDGIRKLEDDPLNHLEREPNLNVFDPRSKVLDLLGTALVIGSTNFRSQMPLEKGKGELVFAMADFEPAGSWTLQAISGEVDSLAIVSSLANSGNVETGEPVGRVKIFARDGRVIERLMLAGRDSSEWAFERADVKPVIKHSLASIYASIPADEGAFQAHKYLCIVPFGERMAVDHVEISRVRDDADIRVFKATIFDSARGDGAPMIAESPEDKFYKGLKWFQDASRWDVVYQHDGVAILRNRRALPRAWMVRSAELVTRDEALEMIRGESQRDFDPRKTALLDNPSFDLSVLGGNSSGEAGSAFITRYEPNRLTVDTQSKETGLLVLGEVYHPGWTATLDGQSVPVERANYLLRSVLVPKGFHRIEMSYTAPGARKGAFVSVGTLLLIAGLVVASRRGYPARTA